MPALKTEHKEFIITQLACFERPSVVQDLLKEHFDIDVPAAQVVYYSPDNMQARTLAKKWRHLFADTRQKYIEEVASVPIANKGFRLNELQKMFDKHSKRGNLVGAAQVLEQAAKEVGGAFESMKDLVPPGGNDSPTYQQINNYIYNRMNIDK